MQYKITHILISLVMVSIIVTVFTMGISNIATTSDLNFDNETLLKYNKMQNVSDTLENVKESEESMETQGGLLDIIGEWFQEGYKALRFTKASIDTIDEMQNNAVQDLELGEAGNIISVGMGLLIFIVIVVGIIIAMVLKRDT
jgi:hypothetical protein